MATQGDGKIVLAGTVGSSSTDVGLARFLASGSLPSLDLESASDTGRSSTDNVTSDTTPSVDIVTPPPGYFRFYCDSVRISGRYETVTSFTGPAQSDGDHIYSVTAVDAAGIESSQSVPLTAGDFVCTVGNTNDPSTWAAAPAPQSITIRPGAGGSDRITLIWGDTRSQTSYHCNEEPQAQEEGRGRADAGVGYCAVAQGAGCISSLMLIDGA